MEPLFNICKNNICFSSFMNSNVNLEQFNEMIIALQTYGNMKFQKIFTTMCNRCLNKHKKRKSVGMPCLIVF